jgi:tetratricopeptide (TPR) repeat protein
MAKKGQLSDIPIEKVFLWLEKGKKTGTLAVSREREQKRVLIKNGKVVHAYSKSPEDQFDALLVREKVLTPTKLNALSKQANGRGVVAALLKEGVISPERLKKLRKYQVRDITLSLLDWEEGEFVFYPDALPEGKYEQQNMPLSKFVEYHRGLAGNHKETARLEPPTFSEPQPSEKRAEQKGASTTAPPPSIPKPTPESVLYSVDRDDIKQLVARMSGEEQDVFILFNGKRTLKEVLSRCKVPRKTLLAILVKFLRSGLLAIKEEPVPEAPAPPVTAARTSPRAAPSGKAARRLGEAPSSSRHPESPRLSSRHQTPPPKPTDPGEQLLIDAMTAHEEGKYYRAHNLLKRFLKENPDHLIARKLHKQYANDLLMDIKKKMVSMKSVPRLTRELNYQNWTKLDPDNRSAFILTRIDGYANLKQIMNVSGFSKGELCMIVYRLIEMGLVTISSAEESGGEFFKTSVDISDEDAARIERVLRVFESLPSSTYYQLLGVKPTDEKETIRQAFIRLSKEFHPDIFRAEHFAPYRNKVEAVYEKMTEAWEHLRQNEKRDEYDQKIGLKSESRHSQIIRKSNAKAKLQYNIARKCIARRDFKRAIEFLQSAMDLEPEEPLYMLRLAEILAKQTRTRKQALDLCRRAVEIEPADPFAYRLMAHIYEQEGDTRSAVKLYYQALQFDSANEQARARIEALTGKPVDERHIKSTAGQLIVFKRKQ